jgi:hypothetical protein
MFKAITLIAMAAAVLSLGACAKDKASTVTKVSTTHVK